MVTTRMVAFVLAVFWGGELVAGLPSVTNVLARQRAGTPFVEIVYDLQDVDSDLLEIAVEFSTDKGTSWFTPSSGLSGDVDLVVPGVGKRIVWDACAVLPTRLFSNVKARVVATDMVEKEFQVVDLSAGADASAYPVTCLREMPAGGWTEEYKTTRLVLRRIAAGSVLMGSPTSELGRYTDENQHAVTLSTDFYLGVFEVTQRQWELVMGNRPSYFRNESYYASRPVEQVSWDDAAAFMARLRSRTGLSTFGLPTEAQWEYACRASTLTALNSGRNLTGLNSCTNMGEVGRYKYNGNYAWFSPDSDISTGTAPVGSFLPNTWGLYDLHGNVYEWCSDWYGNYTGDANDPAGPSSGSDRVFRSGCWFATARYCRSALRAKGTSDYRIHTLGFRAARPLSVPRPMASCDAALFSVDLELAPTVRGRVFDAAGRGPAEGARVALAGLTTVTAADGRFSLAGSRLSEGNMLTIDKDGCVQHLEEVAPPPGAVDVTLPDIRLAAGDNPVITHVAARYEGLFLGGVPVANTYAATVNWNGASPGKVRFLANGAVVAEASGTGPVYRTELDMASAFAPAPRFDANVLSVEAVSAAGARAEPVTRHIGVVPVPSALAAFGRVADEACRDIQVESDFTVPSERLRQEIELPLVGRFGAVVAADASFDWTVRDGAWELAFGVGGAGKRDRRPTAPDAERQPHLTVFAGSGEIAGEVAAAAHGAARIDESPRLGSAAGDASVTGGHELGLASVTDLVGGDLLAGLADLPGLAEAAGASAFSVRVQHAMRGTVSFKSDPKMALERLEMSGFSGLESAYEARLGDAWLRLMVGGGVDSRLRVPEPLLADVRLQAYAGAECVFGLVAKQAGRVFWRSPDSGEGVWAEAVSTDWQPVGRPNLTFGPETFVARCASEQRARATDVQPPENCAVVANVFPHGAPVLAARGCELMLLYVGDNEAPQTLQCTDIRWSRWDGTTWSAPASIAADTRAEFSPQVVFDAAGDAVAVWERVADPAFSHADPAALAAQLEIVWSRWSRETGTWSAPQALTTNGVVDHAPLLCGAEEDGGVLVVWTRNNGNLLTGTSGEPDHVLAAHWSHSVGAWSAEETLLAAVSNRLSQSLACSTNGYAVYGWTADADGVLTNGDDQEVFICEHWGGSWGAVQQVTADTAPDRDIRLAVTQGTRSVREGFETGDFSHLPWTLTGDAVWAVQRGGAFEGAFAAASCAVADGQSAGLQLVCSCPEGEVSFRRKVSTEFYGDFFVFLLDGCPMVADSGEVDWTVSSVYVPAGVHTFEWRYEKNAEAAQGSDRVWIDSVTIPGEVSDVPMAVWRRGGDLVLRRGEEAALRMVRADSSTAGFADCALTKRPDGVLALLWQEMGEAGPDAYYRFYDPASDTWGRDARLCANAGLKRSFAPVWDDLGNLAVAYCHAEVQKVAKSVELAGGGAVTVTNVPQPGRVDVCVTRHPVARDLAILDGDFTAEGGNWLPGDTVRLRAVVRNVGDVPCADVSVAFFDGDPEAGGSLIAEPAMSGWIEGTGEGEAQALWVVPGPATNHSLYAVANRAGLASEADPTNNSRSVSVGGSDLEVALVSYEASPDGALKVYAQVRCAGATGAAASTLSVRRCDVLGGPQPGEPLATAAVPSLEPGRLAQVALELPAGTQPPGGAFYRLLADERGAVPDVDPADNVAVFSVYLWVDTDGDGLPDIWETAKGLNASDPLDAETDADGDGLKACEEYVYGLEPERDDTDGDGMKDGAEIEAGTDPLSSESLLRITRLGERTSRESFSFFPVTFQSVSNKTYVIQVAAAVTGAWFTISEPFTAVSNRTQVLVRMQEGMRQAFYRVRTSQAAALQTFTLGYDLPDQWLLTYDWSRLAPEVRWLRNASDDPDGDGFDNQAEMAAGTDPADAASCLRLTSFTADGGLLSGGIQSVTGRIYYVESRLIGEDVWRPVTGWLEGHEGVTPWRLAQPPHAESGLFRATLGVPAELTVVVP